MELRRRNVICRNRTEHKNKQQPVPFFCKADTPAGRDAENSAHYCLARCIRTYFQAFPDSLYLKPRTFYLRAGSRTFYLSPPCQTTEAFKSVCVWASPGHCRATKSAMLGSLSGTSVDLSISWGASSLVLMKLPGVCCAFDNLLLCFECASGFLLFVTGLQAV